jgi:hypothetical protein
MKFKSIATYSLITITTLLLVFIVFGNDNNDEHDIRISEYKHYINNTEHYDISTYNGYKCVGIDKQYDEDNNDYIIKFKFKKIN